MEERELEDAVVNKVGEVISAIKNAKHVDQVICALHSIASLLFPLDPSLLSGSLLYLIIPPFLFTIDLNEDFDFVSHFAGSIDESYRDQVCVIHHLEFGTFFVYITSLRDFMFLLVVCV